MNAENKAYALELLHTYGLYDFKDKYPSQLSGGMRQRAALIRTLAVKPEILLLDEAFSALDYQTRLAVTEDIYSIIKNENKTAIMVTHDISESISMSDRVIVLTKRPALIKSTHAIKFDCPNRTPLNVVRLQTSESISTIYGRSLMCMSDKNVETSLSPERIAYLKRSG